MAKKNTRTVATHLLRVVKQELMIDGSMSIEVFCISTDDKITDVNGYPVTIGSKLTEVDTGKVYLYDPSENKGWTDQAFPETNQASPEVES